MHDRATCVRRPVALSGSRPSPLAPTHLCLRDSLWIHVHVRLPLAEHSQEVVSCVSTSRKGAREGLRTAHDQWNDISKHQHSGCKRRCAFVCVSVRHTAESATWSSTRVRTEHSYDGHRGRSHPAFILTLHSSLVSSLLGTGRVRNRA